MREQLGLFGARVEPEATRADPVEPASRVNAPPEGIDSAAGRASIPVSDQVRRYAVPHGAGRLTAVRWVTKHPGGQSFPFYEAAYIGARAGRHFVQKGDGEFEISHTPTPTSVRMGSFLELEWKPVGGAS